MAELDKKAADCKYTGYVDQYVTYPPKGPLPLPGKSTEADDGCDLWDEIFSAALIVNPAFNIYRIFDTVRAQIHHFPRVLAHPYLILVPYPLGCSRFPRILRRYPRIAPLLRPCRCEESDPRPRQR